jgi:hypothetical protein
MEDDLNQEVNANVYEWFVVQRERNIINQLQQKFTDALLDSNLST